MATETTPLTMRDLTGARNAYASNDIEASKQAHAAKKHEEDHSEMGGHIKSVVFGGLDGTLTSFAIVAGAAGGSLSWQVVLILGFSNIFADALSMGVGEFLSSKAETDYALGERKREAWEMKHNREGEIEEMVNIYVSRGMGREDALKVITTMAKYEDFFVDVMMVEELGLMVPDADESGLGSAVVMFLSFASFGAMPLVGYAIIPAIMTETSSELLFIIACVVTGLTLFALGCAKGVVSGSNWFKSGSEMTLLGGACAALAFGIGHYLQKVMPEAADI